MPAVRARVPTGLLAAVPALLLAVALVIGLALMAPDPALAAPTGAARTSCVPPPVAHRGASASAPENTRPAFRKALAGGVRLLEMDVHFTSDDVPVLMHDSTVDRTTDGTGAVSAFDLAGLRRLDAGSWFGRSYRGTRVPALWEVLRDGRYYRAQYFVELKVRPTAVRMQALLDTFSGVGVTSRVVVTSFDAATLADVHAAAPQLRTALVDTRLRAPGSVLESGHAYLPQYATVNASRARAWRAEGVRVFPWLVRRQRDWSRMAADRVDGTITNAPVSYLRWARRRCT